MWVIWFETDTCREPETDRGALLWEVLLLRYEPRGGLAPTRAVFRFYPPFS